MLPIRKDWVSVIIPTYNRAKTLPTSINACLEQTYRYVEVIVVDDGSTDNTLEILNAFKTSNPERFRFILQKHLGACVARNRGLEAASGEFVQFLDSDDLILREKLSVQVDALKSSPNPVAVCDFKLTGAEPQYTVLNEYSNNGNLKQVLSTFGSISISTPLIRTESLLKDLHWDSQLERNQDMNFMFRYFLTIKDWEYTPGFYYYWVKHDGDQISDTCYQGPQYDVLFCSAYKFWKLQKTNIPTENNWMLRRYALTLAPHLSLRLRIFAAFVAIGPPLNLSRLLRAFLIIARASKEFLFHMAKKS